MAFSLLLRQARVRRTGSPSRGPGSRRPGFWAVPRMKGRSGQSARSRCAHTSSLPRARAQVVVGQQLDRVQLVRRPKAVEEVHERDARLERRGLRHEREVGALPGRMPTRAVRSPSGGPPSRPVITEDRQPLGRQRAGGACNTVGVNSPAILYMFGIINNRPCEAVNVVASAPPSAHRGGSRPRRLRFASRPPLARSPRGSAAPGAPLVGGFAHRRRRCDRADEQTSLSR